MVSAVLDFVLDVSDLSQIGVDVDNAILNNLGVGSSDRIDLGQLALSTGLAAGLVLDDFVVGNVLASCRIKLSLFNAVGPGGSARLSQMLGLILQLDAQIVIDGAAVDLSRVGSDGGVNVVRENDFLAVVGVVVRIEGPLVARTAEGIDSQLDAQVPLVSQQLAGEGSLGVADESNIRAEGDDLAVLNSGSLQSVQHDLSSVVTGQALGVVEIVANAVQQADCTSQVTGTDGVAGTNQALFLGVEAENDQDHLQELDAGDVSVRSVLVVANASDDAGVVAVRDEALCPVAGLHIGEVDRSVKLLDVGIAIVKHSDDLGSFCTGDHTVGLIFAILVAVQNADCGENIDSLGMGDILGVFEVRSCCTRNGGKAQNGSNGQNESKNLFEVLH